MTGRSPAELVDAFYRDIWNRGDLAATADIVSAELRFRGSLGTERQGCAEFLDYVRQVRAALADYECIIDDLVCEGAKAFARMTFRGRHEGSFLGFPPTGLPLSWAGAALFTISEGRIVEVWVLGDLVGLKAQLEDNAGRRRIERHAPPAAGRGSAQM